VDGWLGARLGARFRAWLGARLLVAVVAAACLALLGPLGAAAAPVAGYDVSYPQCAAGLPERPAFGIVGVNGGLAYSANPCLAAEYRWAARGPRVGFYLNTGNPGPQASSHWPAAGSTSPQPCDGSWSAGCAFDYGWLAAQDSFSMAVAVAGPSAARSAPWWLDVETANSWSTDPSTNRRDLQGALAALQAAGVSSVGIYSTASMWGQITGATTPGSALNDPFRSLPNWVPGAHSASEAASLCTRSLAGGPVLLVQYPAGGFDANYVCG
jgi:hypothetical protein